MLDDFLHLAYAQSHVDAVVCGDFNANVRDGPFVQQLVQIRWCPLTWHTDCDFTTFRRARGVTSAIDSIILSPRMVEYASPIQTLNVLEHGHNVVHTMLTHNMHAHPTWEVHFPEAFFEDGDQENQLWQRHSQSLKRDFAHQSVDALWDSWCEALHAIHKSTSSSLGRNPTFRLRDEHKAHRLYDLLQQAIFQEDEQAKKHVNQKLHVLSKNEFRKWRNRISGKNMPVGQWLRKLFKWCKGCSIPVPSCTASDVHGQQGYTTCLAESLLEVRDFYKRLYLKNREDASGSQAEVLDHQEPEDDQIQVIYEILRSIISRADASKAPGIDGLQVFHFKQLPVQAVFALAIIFHKALVQSKLPNAWLICKVSCVPKKQGQTKVQDLRPLTVAPVVYRLFGKTLLTLNGEFCQNVDSASVGGIPKRSAYEAWFPAALACEASWRAKPEYRAIIQGVAIDTHKFFDYVPQSKACEALLAVGLPHAHVATWAYAIKHIRRHVSLNGAILTESFGCDIGVPQGDPVSMLAAASLLGLWTAQLPREPTLARVFVDDRLLLSSDQAHLLECFHTTEFWDEQHGFLTHFKTVAFGNNHPNQNLCWTRGYEVKRQKHIAYLGVPLPCKGLPRFKFFEPILDKCHAVLERLIRAKVSHYVAREVVARKVLPAVTYATTVARPTRDQIDRLRTKIYAAAAFRHCQTQDAHALLIEKTHQFDPEFAIIYTNLLFWRRLYCNQPQLVQAVQRFFDECMPLNKALYGPVTLLQHDLTFLDCQFFPQEGVITHFSGLTCSLLEPSKQKFGHFCRELIRIKLTHRLHQKHPKWQGILQLEIKPTTALLRSLPVDSPVRNALIRLLTDAHATPYRAYKMNLQPTGHCPYCLHEVGDLQHILWHCVRFQPMREAWPDAMRERRNWPPCAINALICTSGLSASDIAHWGQFQSCAAQLLNFWMCICRHQLQEERFPAQPDGQAPAPIGNASFTTPYTSQFAPIGHAGLLDLRWDRPLTRSKMHSWGGNAHDFNLLFSFWAKWTSEPSPRATPVKCWLQALILFISVGGFSAHFLLQCEYIGIALFKFKKLTKNLLLQCAVQDIQVQGLLQVHGPQCKWIANCPLDTCFPDTVFFAPKWNIGPSVDRISLLQAKLTLQYGLNNQVIRIPPVQFIEAIECGTNILETEDISVKWVINRQSGKAAVPTWVQQVLDLRSQPAGDPLSPANGLYCISQIPLETWVTMSPNQVRRSIKQACKRFLAAQKRNFALFTCFNKFVQSASDSSAVRTHVIEPSWTCDFACFSCGKSVPYSKTPEALLFQCHRPYSFNETLKCEWHTKFFALDQKLCKVLALLGHAPVNHVPSLLS